MFFWIGQALTVLGYGLYYASRYCREKTNLVKGEAVSKIVIAVSFLFLNNMSGVMANLITMLRSILIYGKEKNGKKMLTAYWIVLALCLLCGFMTYKSIFSTFSYVAAVITTTAAWFGTPQQIRKWGIVASAFYLIFQISSQNYMGIVFECGTMLMSITSYVKYARE